MEERPLESQVILQYILRRIKKGLGLNGLFVGPPGIGKSYVCLRLAERLYEEQYGEKIDIKKHVVNDLPSAFKFVRNVKRPGEPLVIEEVSVIASARRSMALENLSIGYLLNTIRKKQVILLMNAPHIKAIDKHIQRMSHILVESLRINKRWKFSTVKAFRLTNSQDTGKVYKKKFAAITGKEVSRSYFYPPSKEIIQEYERTKSEFMEGLYEKMEVKNEKKMGIEKPKQERLVAINVEMTDMEKKCYELKQTGMTNVAIAKQLNLKYESSVRGALLRYKNRVDKALQKENAREMAVIASAN